MLFKHTKNNRIITQADIRQTNHYYPFGLNMEGNWTSSGGNGEGNKYSYNGKELNDDFGLGWNHHDWRFLDVAINRFVTIDPESEEDEQEQFSPYHFALNNPILYDDPDGRNPIGALIGAAVEYGTQVATNYAQGNPNPWTSNISISAIVVAGVEGAVTSGASAGKKIAMKVGAALINNTVDVRYGDETGQGGLNVKVEKNPSNIVKNASVDIIADAGAKGVGNKLSKTGQKATASAGVNNGSTTKLVKQAVTNSGAKVTRNVNQQIKSGVKK
ncbi:MAG: hypothetical protein HC817_07925 [Saprospiraceae bacterium]|nr:hypothetical protein [Saprospiraceae bacterium]